MAIRLITNVPPEHVEEVVDAHRSAGATSVTTSSETDGEFTVVAVYPDIERFTPAAPASTV